ncbi:beta-aspartyl-peptidase, partial [Klebsiella aerogenes]
MGKAVIAIHGGAGGQKMLAAGASALDAVTEAVR